MISTSLADLRQNGAVLLPGFFSQDQVLALKTGIDYDNSLESPFKANINKAMGSGMTTNIWRTSDVKQFADYCTGSELINLINKIFYPQPFRFLQDTWFLRPNDCTVSIPWHHDNIVVGDHYSAWVSLTEHKLEDSLCFVAGSHNDGFSYMPLSYFVDKQDDNSDVDKYYRSYNMASTLQLKETFIPIPSDEELIKSRHILSWPTSPGDCIIFNSRTLHSLPSGDGDYERIGFVSRWIADGSTIALHAEDTVKAIQNAGLSISLSVGDPISGDQFPLYQ
jgi:ectoine hydroxylase-related dioxygenase (phytanoyl-CoA dioxygenase family)